MIKSYFEFSQYESNTLGEYIEDLSQDDNFIRSIVGEYTKSIDPDIRISNSVNVLDKFDKIELLKRVESYLNNEIKDVNITTTIDIDDVIDESYGKNVFSTFLKCLTSLGLKETPPSKETPNDFLVFFKFEDLDYLRLESIFNRYKSLSSLEIRFVPDMCLYMGIKNGKLEYGYETSILNIIGSFDLSNKNLNWIKTSNLKSLSELKKLISNLSSKEINLMCNIKNDFSKFIPDHADSMISPYLDGDGIITFGYYGMGNWNNGQLLDSDLLNFKEICKLFISKFKWSNRIVVSINPSKFWIYVKIKIK